MHKSQILFPLSLQRNFFLFHSDNNKKSHTIEKLGKIGTKKIVVK